MPDLSIPNLPAATLPLTGNEITVVSQAGVASSVLISDLPTTPPELTADELDAVQGANAPDSANVFATMNDLPTQGVETVTGGNVDNTDPLNPIINNPSLQDVIDTDNTVNTFDFGINGTDSAINITRLSNFTGMSLIALGDRTLSANSGDFVVGIGDQSARDNTGDFVNAIGYNSARGNTGLRVNAFGHEAAFGNISNNVNAFGVSALMDNTGFSSVAFGENSGRKNSGGYCTFIGDAAGYDVMSDTGNSINSQFVIANTNMPSYTDRTAATTAITVLLGAVAGNTYLYYNQTTFAIEGVRL